MPEYYFQSDRLGFRAWREADLEPLTRMNADPEGMEFFPSTLTPEQTLGMYTRFSEHISRHGFGFFAVDLLETATFIGFIGLSHPRFESFFTPCVEIGWRLEKPYWGRGLATEGALACLNYGFSTLRLDKIYSFTALPNQRSERVMIKAGMEKTGEFDHPSIPDGHYLKRHVLYLASSIQPPASSLQHPASSLQHPASSIQPLASSI